MNDQERKLITNRVSQGLPWSGIVDEVDLGELSELAQSHGMVLRELPGQSNEVAPYVLIDRTVR